MCCVIREVLDCGIRCSKKRKSYTLKSKLEADESGGSNRSRGGGGLTALF